MPAAAKMMADAPRSRRVGGRTGKDGRVTKGDVLGVLAMPKSDRSHRLRGRRCQAPAGRGGAGGDQLGDRPEQRVPMSRLRARVASGC